MLALLFASGASLALIAGRILWTGRLTYLFLVWNLFLAWLPLVFALLACDEYRRGEQRTWHFRALAITWLLFFPNAPYIFTDLIHLTSSLYLHFWVDMVLILLCAVVGLVLGFVSLFLMQTVVVQMLGRVASWLFIAAVAGASGFGIYLGRFLRFNTWDVLCQPMALCRGIGRWAVSDPAVHPTAFAFPVLFATFLFLAYVMLYGLTHLQPALPAPARVEP